MEQAGQLHAVALAQPGFVHPQRELRICRGDAGAVVAEADPPAEVEGAAVGHAVAVAIGDHQRALQADQVGGQLKTLARMVVAGARRLVIDIAVLVEGDHAAGRIHRQGEHRVRRGDFLSAGRGGADDHTVDVEQADRRAVAGQAAVVALGAGQRQGIAHRHIAAAIRTVLCIDLEGEGEIGTGAVMPGAQRGGVVGLQ
ncbi:hypothetical protein D3C81_1272140 [compost metagenome]